MSSKIAKGSFLLVIGAFLFRIGGYIYKVAMANLLGPSGYGILSFTWPLQNFLIMIATAGLPPAIAKHVSEYYAKDDPEMVKAVISISIRMMIALGLVFSVVIFVLAKPIAIGFFNKLTGYCSLPINCSYNTLQCYCRCFEGYIPGILSDEKYSDNKGF